MPETLSLPIHTLEWAAQKVGLSMDSIAPAISKRNPDSIAAGKLTFAQARKFAEITKQPLGFLFLENPPADYQIDLPDLRTRKKSTQLSVNLVETYRDVKYKQEWYKEYLTGIGAVEHAFVGKFSVDNKTEDIANHIRSTLHLSLEHIKAKDIDEYYDMIGRLAENVGILVFRNGIVKSNTHRPLDEDEFLGFAISDRLAPTIFINAADKTAAKVFTIAHELAHIWIGASGITDIALNAKDKVELKCNAVATELLIPKSDFLSAWNATTGDLSNKLVVLRSQFHVSELVIARLAAENNKITSQQFWDLYNDTKKFFESQKSDGGNGRAMPPIRNSRVFMRTVTGLLGSGKISFKEASMLLNISPMKVGSYVQQ